MNQELTLFIADGSHIVRECLAHVLSALQGLQVVGSAESRTQAVTSIRDLRPDIVILDSAMFIGGGADLMRAIHESGFEPIVIVLCATPSPHAREDFLRLGATHFFDKTRDFNNLIKALLKLIDQFACTSRH